MNQDQENPSAPSDQSDPSDEVTFVTKDDHLAGYKDIPVILKTGEKKWARITAPDRRATRALDPKGADLDQVIEICQPRLLNEEPRTKHQELIDEVEPISAALIEATCITLTFGNLAEKKMIELGKTVMANLDASPTATHSTKSSNSKPPSSATATRTPKFNVGPTPSFNSFTKPPPATSSPTSSPKPSPSGTAPKSSGCCEVDHLANQDAT